jgi:hypothetical protein
MRVGIHLPHIGRKAGPEGIRRAAIQAEELGFADAWTSEHIIGGPADPRRRGRLARGRIRRAGRAVPRARPRSIKAQSAAGSPISTCFAPCSGHWPSTTCPVMRLRVGHARAPVASYAAGLRQRLGRGGGVTANFTAAVLGWAGAVPR